MAYNQGKNKKNFEIKENKEKIEKINFCGIVTSDTVRFTQVLT